MGILERFLGKKPREKEQAEIAKETKEMITIDEKINNLIKDLKEALNNLKENIKNSVSIRDTRKFLFDGLIKNMISELDKIQGMESISKEDESIKNLMVKFAKVSQWLRKTEDFDPLFADDWARIRSNLYELEKKLQLEKSILKEEFEKLKKEI